MNVDNTTVTTLGTVLGWAAVIVFAPVTLPWAVGTNYRGTAERLKTLPGVRPGGGVASGAVAFVYVCGLCLLLGGATAATVGPSPPEDDTTTQEKQSPTVTPDSDGSENTPSGVEANNSTAGPSPSVFDVSNATASRSQVMAGRTASVNATVSNAGTIDGKQKVRLVAAGAPVNERTVSLEKGETARVSFEINTSTRPPGQYTFTVISENDSDHVRVTITENRTYDRFFENIRTEAIGIKKTQVFTTDAAGIIFQHSEKNFERITSNEAYDVLPQAVALEMAANPEHSPEVVNVLMENADGKPVWDSNINQSLAERYANGSITPHEFRAELAATANGPWSDRGPNELRLTWTTGERAYLAYGGEIVERLESSPKSDMYEVVDYGIYNGTITLPDTTRTIDPGDAIYIEFQTPRDTQVEYRNFSTTYRAVTLYETLIRYANVSVEQQNGELPQAVHVRNVDSQGRPHTTYEIPTEDALLVGTDQEETLDIFSYLIFEFAEYYRLDE